MLRRFAAPFNPAPGNAVDVPVGDPGEPEALPTAQTRERSHAPSWEAHAHHAMNEVQAAELIGQFAHMIDLLEIAYGRNLYNPLVVDLSQGTKQIVSLPVEGHQIEQVQVSGDTAVTVKLYVLNGRTRGLNNGNGLLIGQVFMPANSVAPPLQLNAPVPPAGDNQLVVITSGAVANGSAVVTLARTRVGSNPDHVG